MTNNHQIAHKRQGNQFASIKMAQAPINNEAQQQQFTRKLFGFFLFYAILIITVYVTYAIYYFYHNSINSKLHSIDEPRVLAQASSAEILESNSVEQQLRQELEVKMETKLHLLERYVELLALDLQETKTKLREREKCDCQMSCTFNGTRYAERSSWQNQCDTCTCQSGRISCTPQKCPQTNCDEAVLLPGQCCPTCMKKCRHNNAIYKHGQKFTPSSDAKSQSKECKCYDGLIKCEPTRAMNKAKSNRQANKQLNSAAVDMSNSTSNGQSTITIITTTIPTNNDNLVSRLLTNSTQTLTSN